MKVKSLAMMAGLGGSWGMSPAPGTAAAERGKEGRILAFALGGGEVPMRPLLPPPPPFEKPTRARPDDAQEIERGATLYGSNGCAFCHQGDAPDGIPDLRRMTEETHAEFLEIVIRGSRAVGGMPAHDQMSTEEAESIRIFLIDSAWKIWEEQTP